MGNFTAQLKLPFGFSYDVNLSYQNFSTLYGAYYNSYYTQNYNNVRSTPDPPANPTNIQLGGRNGVAFRNAYQSTNKILETYITWDRKLGEHSINAVLGYSWQETINGDGLQTSSTNFPVDDVGFNNLSLGDPYSVNGYRINLGGDSYRKIRLISDFGRLNYGFKDKYLLQGSIRRDGASVFGKNFQWGYFPSISVAWKIAEEGFMVGKHLFNDLKLRGSYDPTYTAFRGSYALQYWFLQSISTDEAVMPARGGNWYDGARYAQLHLHTWNRDNGFINDTWNWLTSVISNSNQNLFLIEKAPASAVKDRGLAEVRTMRAMAYFMMMDIFGNVPIVTKFGDTTLPVTTQRNDVFAFIEKEVKEAIPFLSAEAGPATYGRPNKYVGYSLLAKMYLNSGVYTGTARYPDAATMCDSIINSGKYALETNYLSMFRYNNGPQIKEFIFAIPFDPAASGGADVLPAL